MLIFGAAARGQLARRADVKVPTGSPHVCMLMNAAGGMAHLRLRPCRQQACRGGCLARFAAAVSTAVADRDGGGRGGAEDHADLAAQALPLAYQPAG